LYFSSWRPPAAVKLDPLFQGCIVSDLIESLNIYHGDCCAAANPDSGERRLRAETK